MKDKGILVSILWAMLVVTVLVIAIFFPHLMGDEMNIDSFIKGVLFSVVAMGCSLVAAYKRDGVEK